MTKQQLQEQFSQPLLTWFDTFGRKNFPWQNPRTPYRVWISEIMLQQTQVKTVIPYFDRFMNHFPDIHHLAAAPEDQVLALWSGLGYYSRARNLIKTAKIICAEYQGEFPHRLEELLALPGIGDSTAAAIASQAFNLPAAILDGNVKRVLCRYFMIEGWPEQATVKKNLWQLANQCMPNYRCADYTQAIMDLGATCCTMRNPNCYHCPLQETCLAKLHDKINFYPQKKPKKALPHRKEQFLLLHTAENQIYLEKRPPIGLWGGLWCIPSIDMNTCPKEHIKKIYNLDCLTAKEMMNLKHSFSHFHLHIKAIEIQVTPSPNTLVETNGRWFKLNEISHIGLAKPITAIITRFQENLGSGDVC
ncbi:A/G-specific adenine glycosylase [Legionella cardiaca]|uniref:Adenine DNA glycosylase n=1 Tax=Legionella cardiaca TaxID=1071983 RepID=A0ABY8AXT9_9GAMM|nr:A/G-specific adenine glycosylase [Legionella cardiaca]WED43962.1 A/G-specific adenine glycosylase [Legionella cardiaca]